MFEGNFFYENGEPIGFLYCITNEFFAPERLKDQAPEGYKWTERNYEYKPATLADAIQNCAFVMIETNDDSLVEEKDMWSDRKKIDFYTDAEIRAKIGDSPVIQSVNIVYSGIIATKIKFDLSLNLPMHAMNTEEIRSVSGFGMTINKFGAKGKTTDQGGLGNSYRISNN